MPLIYSGIFTVCNRALSQYESTTTTQLNQHVQASPLAAYAALPYSSSSQSFVRNHNAYAAAPLAYAPASYAYAAPYAYAAAPAPAYYL
ncbi:hypothetical protein HCN44_001369 [Aphidius gifuensis]|uniref:Uncharacterized protein n=1 Tax=Aphidius gifuensis TaxID=684658 RepID=A0A835CQQ9_APHGI|nr:hypothetical protein HCN44_001369 [Aphidius gifuensis]